MTLVLLQVAWQLTLVAKASVVDGRETCQPVAMLQFAISLDVVLTSCEIPHEVAPVHEVELIAEEELHIVGLGRNLHASALCIFVRNGLAFHTTEPLLIEALVLVAVDAREEHALIAWIHVFKLLVGNHVLVLLVGTCLFLLLINFRTFLGVVNQSALCVFHHFWYRIVGLSVEERTVAILLTSEVFTKCEHILRRVLVHWRVGV